VPFLILLSVQGIVVAIIPVKPAITPTYRQKWSLKKVVILSILIIRPQVVLSAIYQYFWNLQKHVIFKSYL